MGWGVLPKSSVGAGKGPEPPKSRRAMFLSPSRAKAKERGHLRSSHFPLPPGATCCEPQVCRQNGKCLFLQAPPVDYFTCPESFNLYNNKAEDISNACNSEMKLFR